MGHSRRDLSRIESRRRLSFYHLGEIDFTIFNYDGFLFRKSRLFCSNLLRFDVNLALACCRLRLRDQVDQLWSFNPSYRVIGSCICPLWSLFLQLRVRKDYCRILWSCCRDWFQFDHLDLLCSRCGSCLMRCSKLCLGLFRNGDFSDLVFQVW